MTRARQNDIAAIEYGETHKLTGELESLTANIKRLETEPSALQAHSDNIDVDEAIEIHENLVDEDREKLSALLEQAGYRIVCDGEVITVNEPAVCDLSPVQNIVYKGVNRKSWTYNILWNGASIEILTPAALSQMSEASVSDVDCAIDTMPL